MDSGTIWLNITTTDAFGRTTIDVYSYIVDAEVTSLPNLGYSGSQIVIGTTTYIAWNTIVQIGNRIDANGVGYSHTECRDSTPNWTPHYGTTTTISSVVNDERNYSLECQIIDQIGNRGPSNWSNGTIDAKPPTIVTDVASGDVLGINSSIGYSCNDTVGSYTSKMTYSHNYETNTSSGLLWLNGTQPTLQQLTLLTVGTLSLTYECIDSFGNSGTEIVGLYYTSIGPSAELLISSNNTNLNQSGLILIGSNGTITIILQANNQNNISASVEIIKLSQVEYTINIYDDANISTENLSDGTYQVLVQICSDILCTNTSKMFTIDTIGPQGNMRLLLNNGTSFSSNSTVKFGIHNSFSVTGMTDSSSGIAATYCTEGGNTYTISSNSNVYIQPSVSNNSLLVRNSQISCYSNDLLGNPSESFNFSVKYDFIAPTVDANLSIDNGFVTSDSQLELACNDTDLDFWIQLQYSVIGGSTFQLLYQSNLTSNIGSSLTNLNHNDSVSMTVGCFDSYGNGVELASQQFVYITSLGNLTLIQLNMSQYGSIIAVGNHSELVLGLNYALGEIEYSAEVNNSQVWNYTTSVGLDNRLNYSLLYMALNRGNPNSIVHLVMTHKISNSNLTSSLDLGRYILVEAPEIVSITQTLLVNGSATSFNLSFSPCSQINVTYSIANTTTSQSVISHFLITMPYGTITNETVNIEIVDCLGNNHSEQFILERDLEAPIIQVQGIVFGKISPNQNIGINISDNSGINNSKVTVWNGTDEEILCLSLSNCGFSFASKSTFTHLDIGNIIIEFTTYSGESYFQNITVEFDSLMEAPYIDNSNSFNTTLMHVSNASIIAFKVDEYASEICYSIYQATEGETCVSNSYQIIWEPVVNNSLISIIIQVNATDSHGNTATSFFTYYYYSTAPIVLESYYRLNSSGWIAINISHPLPFVIEELNQSSTNSTLYFSQNGIFTLNLTISDVLGNSVIEIIHVTVDLTDPSIIVGMPNPSYIGRNSTLSIQSYDNESQIENIRIDINSYNLTCFLIYSVGDLSFVSNHSIQEILNTTACGIDKYDNHLLYVNITVITNVSRLSNSQFAIQYIGKIGSLTISGANISVANNIIYTSNYSSLSCDLTHIITVNSQITAPQGNSSRVNANLIDWNSGNGTINCFASDVLGNHISKNWQLIYKKNDIIVNLDVVNGTLTHTKSGTGNLHMQWESEHSISQISMSINGTIQLLEPSQNMTVSIGIGNGIRVIVLEFVSELGYSNVQYLNLTLDDNAPTLLISSSSEYNVDVINSTITLKSTSVQIMMARTDQSCSQLPSMTLTNSTLLFFNSSVTTIQINSSSTQFQIEIEDCVGWKTINQFDVIIKNSISQPFRRNLSQVIIFNATTMSARSNFSMIIQSLDDLELDIQCTIGYSPITCSNVGYNTWELSVQGILNESSMQFNLTDSIGNKLTLQYLLILDETPPQCNFDGFWKNGFLHVINVHSVEVICSDNLLEITSINAYSPTILESTAFSNTTILNLSNSTSWQILSFDSLGNKQIYQFNISADNSPPLIECTLGNRDSSTLNYYVNGTVTLYCNVEDSTTTTSHYWVNHTTSSYSVPGGPYLGSFALNIPNGIEGTRFNVTIQSRDSLGNQISMTKYFQFDRTAPAITLQSLDLGENIIDEYHMRTDGTYILTMTDVSFDYLSLSIICENGLEIGAIITENSIELNDYIDILLCGTSMELTVSAFDTASNYLTITRTINIDRENPQMIFSSSCTILPENQIQVFQSSCEIVISVTDDSSLPREITMYYGSSQQISTNTMTIKVSDFPLNQLNRLQFYVVDGTGREIIEYFEFKNDPSLEIKLLPLICEYTGVECEPEQSYNVDFVLTEPTLLGFVNQNDTESISLTSVSGTLCPKNFNNTCVQIISFPQTLDITLEGNYWLNITAEDQIGRAIMKSYAITYVTGSAVIENIVAYPIQDTSQNSTLLLCETCNLEFQITESHRPIVLSNIGVYQMSQTAWDKWDIRFDLNVENVENIDSQDKEIRIQISNAGDYQTILQYNWIQAADPVIKFSTEYSDCISYDDDDKQLYCIYNNTLTPSEIQLRISSESANNNSAFSVDFTPIGLNLLPNHIYSGQLAYNSAQNITIYLEAGATVTEYSTTINYLSTIGIDKEINITFVSHTAFRPSFKLFNRSITVHEEGIIDFSVNLTVEFPDNNPVPIDEVEYMKTLIPEMAEFTQCTLSGSRSTLTGERGNLKLDKSRSEDWTWNCGVLSDLTMEYYYSIDNEPRIRIEMSSALIPGMLYQQGSNETIDPLYLFNSPDVGSTFSIKIFEPYTKKPINIRIDKEYLQLKFTDNGDNTVVGQGCKDIIDSNELYLEEIVNWTKLSKCFGNQSIYDPDFTSYAGISITYEKNKQYVLLCDWDELPTTFDAWFKTELGSKPEFCISPQGYEEAPKPDVRYQNIEFKIISCDARCKVEGNLYLYEIIGEAETTDVDLEKPTLIDAQMAQWFAIAAALLLVMLTGYFVVVPYIRSFIQKWFTNEKA